MSRVSNAFRINPELAESFKNNEDQAVKYVQYLKGLDNPTTEDSEHSCNDPDPNSCILPISILKAVSESMPKEYAGFWED